MNENFFLREENEIINQWNGEFRPKLSICCTAYNHVKFLSNALNSFLSQVTSFPFEIIIRDDASIDGTSELIQTYVLKYPNIIKPIFEQDNQYIKGIRPLPVVLNAAIGEYVAICEGDDYWIDENKLQKQVDFLDINLAYSMCFHNVILLQNNVFFYDNITKNVSNTTRFKELARSNFVHTLSIVFRRKLISNFDLFYNNKEILGDFYLNLWISQFGSIYKFNDIMGVYRLHKGGIWSSKKYQEREIVFLKTLFAFKKIALSNTCAMFINFSIVMCAIKSFMKKIIYFQFKSAFSFLKLIFLSFAKKQ